MYINKYDYRKEKEDFQTIEVEGSGVPFPINSRYWVHSAPRGCASVLR